jgi:hypothetical protein
VPLQAVRYKGGAGAWTDPRTSGPAPSGVKLPYLERHTEFLHTDGFSTAWFFYLNLRLRNSWAVGFGLGARSFMQRSGEPQREGGKGRGRGGAGTLGEFLVVRRAVCAPYLAEVEGTFWEVWFSVIHVHVLFPLDWRVGEFGKRFSRCSVATTFSLLLDARLQAVRTPRTDTGLESCQG